MPLFSGLVAFVLALLSLYAGALTVRGNRTRCHQLWYRASHGSLSPPRALGGRPESRPIRAREQLFVVGVFRDAALIAPHFGHSIRWARIAHDQSGDHD